MAGRGTRGGQGDAYKIIRFFDRGDTICLGQARIDLPGSLHHMWVGSNFIGGGNTEDPRGGVRWIMPVKAPYWKK